jgi:hypothetical protein
MKKIKKVISSFIKRVLIGIVAIVNEINLVILMQKFNSTIVKGP